MNTAPASVIIASLCEPLTWNRIRKTSAFLRKLSLKAEKNWHQNKGAKRRDSINGPEFAGVCTAFPQFDWKAIRRLCPGVTRRFKPPRPCDQTAARLWFPNDESRKRRNLNAFQRFVAPLRGRGRRQAEGVAMRRPFPSSQRSFAAVALLPGAASAA